MTTSPEPTNAAKGSDKRRRVRFAEVVRDPGDLLSFGLGAGCAPFAPGTFGTLVGLALFLVLPPVPLLPYLLACAIAATLGAWLCGRTATRLGVRDHSGIVLDEVVGYLLTMAAYQAGRVPQQHLQAIQTANPAAGGLPDPMGGVAATLANDVEHLLWALAGFGLFRLFDILKPWPISWLDRNVHGGIGIMLDDVAAGLLALVCMIVLESLAG